MTIEELVYIDANGYFFADYPTFLAFVQDQYRTIYGADVYLEADSQDGQWLAIQARMLYDTAALGASIYNSFSPATAQGVGLSRNVKINGIDRRVPTNSTVDVLIVGQAGTEIINGVVQDSLEQKWDLPASVVIPNDGDITVTATAQELGAVSAAPNTVTRIFTPTRGWQTVNNPTAATEGEPVETDAELRVRQAQSTANPSLTVLDGTIGGVANLDGVTDVRGYENDTGSTDGNGIPAHSIAIVVEGGVTQEIGDMIALHKTPGTRTYGTTNVDTVDAHGMPLTIHFYRPDPIAIEVQVTIAVNPVLWTSDYETLIKQAVADYINSIGIGSNVLISRLYSPAYLTGTVAGASYDIALIEIAIVGDPLGTINIPIAFNEVSECDVGDVTIVVT